VSVLSRIARYRGNFVFQEVGLPPLKPTHRVRWLSAEQTHALLDVTRKDRHLRLVLLLGLAQGLRRGEWVRLRMADVDLENTRLRIRGRSRTSPREEWVGMHPALPDAFRDYLWFRRRRVRRFLRQHPDSSVPEELFLHVRGGALSSYRPHATDKWVQILDRRLASRGMTVGLSTDMLRRRGAVLLEASLRELPEGSPEVTQRALQAFLRTETPRGTRNFLRALRSFQGTPRSAPPVREGRSGSGDARGTIRGSGRLGNGSAAGR
jgi:integrase